MLASRSAARSNAAQTNAKRPLTIAAGLTAVVTERARVSSDSVDEGHGSAPPPPGTPISTHEPGTRTLQRARSRSYGAMSMAEEILLLLVVTVLPVAIWSLLLSIIFSTLRGASALYAAGGTTLAMLLLAILVQSRNRGW